MNPTPTNPQPVHRISDAPPVFPCWAHTLHHPSGKEWIWFETEVKLSPAYKYWSPDAPTAPTVRPGETVTLKDLNPINLFAEVLSSPATPPSDAGATPRTSAAKWSLHPNPASIGHDRTAIPSVMPNEAKQRAEWLHLHNAPHDWVILTSQEVQTLKAVLAERDREIKRWQRLCENAWKQLDLFASNSAEQHAATLAKLERYERRLDWLMARAKVKGGGDGADYTITFRTPIDTECDIAALDAAMTANTQP